MSGRGLGRTPVLLERDGGLSINSMELEILMAW